MTDYLAQLPPELLVQIAEKLSKRRLLLLSLVSKLCNQLVCELVCNFTLECHSNVCFHSMIEKFRIKKLCFNKFIPDTENLSLITNLQSLKLKFINLKAIRLEQNLSKLVLVQCSNFKLDQISALSRIEELDLSYTQITDTDLKQFNFPKLRKLSLEGCRQITNDGLSFLSSIVSLQLSYTGIADGLKYLTRLTSLSVNYCENISDVNLYLLTNLRKLNVKHTQVTGDCFQYLTNLMKVDLSRTLVRDETVTKLTKCEKIILDYCYGVGNSSLTYLTNLHHIRYIGLHYIESESIGKLTNLTNLNSSFLSIQNADLEKCTNLRGLILSPNKRDLTLKTIRNLTNLRSLELSLHQLGDDIVSELVHLRTLMFDLALNVTDASITKLTNLDLLECGRSNVTSDGLEYLKARGVLVIKY